MCTYVVLPHCVLNCLVFSIFVDSCYIFECSLLWSVYSCLFKRFYLFLEREGREEERERNISVNEKHRSFTSSTPPTSDLACNPGMCPDREWNLRPFSLQANAQPPEPGQDNSCLLTNCKIACKFYLFLLIFSGYFTLLIRIFG